ncbi:MAG: hypothetical protein ACYTEM_03660 [Planctomycetota bacterium]
MWPGRIEAGKVCDEPVAGHDILATLAALVGTEVPDDQAMDSLNILPLLLGDKKGDFQKREDLLLQGGSHNEVIYRQGPWKLIIQSNHECTQWDPVALFHLEDNPTEVEASNLIDKPEHQGRVQDMLKTYLDIRKSKKRTVPASPKPVFSGASKKSLNGNKGL